MQPIRITMITALNDNDNANDQIYKAPHSRNFRGAGTWLIGLEACRFNVWLNSWVFRLD